MKQIFIFFTVCFFLLLSVTSCTDKNNDEVTQRVEPGVYYIGKDLSAVVPNPTTKGVTEDFDFDTNYDYDIIYLHKIGGQADECIKIPVIDNCPGESGTCKGIRYRVEVDNSGNATITPLDADNYPVANGGTLELAEKDQCYFSSWPRDEWAMNANQWEAQQWAGKPEAYYIYYRDRNINQELYRSGYQGNKEDLSISDLTQNGDLNLTRACAGFMLATILYDGSYNFGTENEPQYVTSPLTFQTIMTDSHEKWYIKMYLGGSCFPRTYNIEKYSTGSQTHPNGYYSSGDSDKFFEDQIVGQYFLPFEQKQYNKISTSYGGFGYKSNMAEGKQNLLFAPVTGNDEIHIYVLIKHWTSKTLDTPPDGCDWLLSDVGAIQTEISASTTHTPAMAEFVQVALLMNLHQFKKAWDAAGGDNEQDRLIYEVAGIDPETGNKIDSSSDSPIPVAYNTVTTRSPSGDPVRSFTLPEDAIIIQEVY